MMIARLMNSITLTIPWLGPSKNEMKGAHWSVYKAHRDAAAQAFAVALAGRKIVIEPPVKITFRAFLGYNMVGQVKKPYDLVNYSDCYKMLEDAAVAAGIIPDDRDKYVQAFSIERPARFKEWHKPGMDNHSHCVLQIESI